jgi:enoyl-CoA hydratase
MYSTYQRIRAERRGRILTLTLNRPEARNATDALMHEELSRIFRDVASDTEADVVVLTGAGDCFSAGGDFNGMLARMENHALWEQGIREGRDMLFSLLDLDKPVIARINGHAIGLGATLALFCDITVAVEDAKIVDPHVKIGLVAGDGGAIIWPLLVGQARAKELLLLGDSISGKQAAAIGLVTHAVTRAELDERVYGLAERLAAGSAQAIQGTKRAVNMQLKAQTHAMLETHLGLETLSHLSDDHRQAVRAFLDKGTVKKDPAA